MGYLVIAKAIDRSTLQFVLFAMGTIPRGSRLQSTTVQIFSKKSKIAVRNFLSKALKGVSKKKGGKVKKKKGKEKKRKRNCRSEIDRDFFSVIRSCRFCPRMICDKFAN